MWNGLSTSLLFCGGFLLVVWNLGYVFVICRYLGGSTIWDCFPGKTIENLKLFRTRFGFNDRAVFAYRVIVGAFIGGALAMVGGMLTQVIASTT